MRKSLFLTVAEAAELLRLKKHTLDNMRWQGTGPPFRKHGGRIFYHRDELGIPDALQRVHWDPAFARKSGNPTTFDYGRMRETWLIHACTDWMGDDAWLWRLRVLSWRR